VALELGLAILARRHLFRVRHAAVFMEGCHYQVKTIGTISTVIAHRKPEGRLRMAIPS
jgi:hypothetical protein